MRRRLLALAALAALNYAAAAAAQPVPLTLTETLTSFVPHGFAADSPFQLNAVEGNSYSYTAALRDQNGRLGSSSGVCAILDGGRAACTISFRLPSGKLLLAGEASVRRPDVLVVAGGSGAFNGLRGAMRVQSSSWTAGLVRTRSVWTLLPA